MWKSKNSDLNTLKYSLNKNEITIILGDFNGQAAKLGKVRTKRGNSQDSLDRIIRNQN